MIPSFVLGSGAEAVYAQQLGRGVVGEVEYSYTWSSKGGGFTSAAFSLLLPPKYDHLSLRNDIPAQMRAGSYVLGHGRITDIDRDNWRIAIAGDVTRAARFMAEGPKLDPGDDAGPPTTNPKVAVEQANLRGLGWNGVGNLPDLSLAEDALERVGYVTLEQLLNRWCELNGKRWGLSNANTPYFADDPSSVGLNLRPGVPGLPTADDDYVTRILMHYVAEMKIATTGDSPVPSRWGTVVAETPIAPRGKFEATEDITDLGLLIASTVDGDSSGTPDIEDGVPGTYGPGSGAPADYDTARMIAQSYADAMLESRSARMRFTAGVDDLRPWQVASNGNVTAGLWVPMAGQRVRQYGMLADSGALAHGRTLEWVVGKSIHRPAERTVTLEPVDLAARSLPDIIAAIPTAEGGTGRATIKLGG